MRYLHFNIFELSLLDMAVGTGSISQRLHSAYCNYLYKVNWDTDIEFIPAEDKPYFLQLKKILFLDIEHTVEKERAAYKSQHTALNISLTEDQLSEMSNSYTAIKKLHWRKAKKAAELIRKLHTYLGHHLKNI